MVTCRISTLSLDFKEVQKKWSAKKMLRKCELSRYVYEKKENMDIMPGGKSNIYVDMTRVLQKTGPCDIVLAAQVALSLACACLVQPLFDLHAVQHKVRGKAPQFARMVARRAKRAGGI